MKSWLPERKNIFLILFFMLSVIIVHGVSGQQAGMYPPFTKWYQDPLGLKPLQLSSAFGFVWGSAAVVASLIFTKKETVQQKKVSAYFEAGAGKSYKPPGT